MGQPAEQTALILEKTAEVIEASKMHAEPNMNYWWMLAIGVVPVVVGWVLHSYFKKKKTHDLGFPPPHNID